MGRLLVHDQCVKQRSKMFLPAQAALSDILVNLVYCRFMKRVKIFFACGGECQNHYVPQIGGFADVQYAVWALNKFYWIK